MSETNTEEKTKKHLSQETKNSIRIMVQGGATLAAVAKEFGVSIATVQRYSKNTAPAPTAKEDSPVTHASSLRQQAEAFVDSLRSRANDYEQKALDTNEAADAVERELNKIA